MTIPIIYEDQVDWEPLIFRFVAAKELSAAEAKQLAKFVQNWMDSAARQNPDVWSVAKEWQCTVTEVQEVTGHCEFLPDSELTRLATEVHKAFPSLKEIRLGSPLLNSTNPGDFDWYVVPEGKVTLDDKADDVPLFEISFTPVTIGQFQAFLDATGYTPMPDILRKHPNFLVENFQLNFGPSPKQVLYGLTYDDAAAFCDWARLRLPTDPELKLFFHSACLGGRQFEYGGECWTSTQIDNDQYATWNGPYRKDCLKDPDGKYRKVLPRHQYEFLEAPCFRVVRPIR